MYFNKKMLLVTILAIIIPLMAVGYASLQQKLVISGTSHVDSNWQIEIISVTESDIVGDAKDKVAPSYTGTTAKFKVSLINPTDSITYNVKIKNLGTLDAILTNYKVDIGDSDAIIYKVTGIVKDKVLKPNDEQVIKIKVSFKEGYIGQPSEANSSNTIKITLDYIQNLGGTPGASGDGEEISNTNLPYSIGDVVSFGGSNWYVIEDSGKSQDYVTLLKQNVLTAVEIGDDYSWKKGSSKPEMAYYWSSTCHLAGTYGTYGKDSYDSNDYTGCAGHNDYEGSKIKEAVDKYMIKYLDTSKLKEVNGYKIRLIMLEELQNNLGYVNYDRTENTPSWVYSNYYWTMTPSDNNTSQVLVVNSSMQNISTNIRSVRPVINLYKSAIE